MADIQAGFSGRFGPRRLSRDVLPFGGPTIQLEILNLKPFFQPREPLDFQFSIVGTEQDAVQAVEISVLWQTEGKGESDLGVHLFERRQRSDSAGHDLRQPSRMRTILPRSPLSYLGQLVKIHWLVRVRVFLTGGEQILLDQPFQLGDALAPSKLPQSDIDSPQEDDEADASREVESNAADKDKHHHSLNPPSTKPRRHTAG